MLVFGIFLGYQFLSLAPENSYDKNEVSDGVEFDLGFAVTYSNLPRTGLSSSLMLMRAYCTRESLTSQERGREPYFSIQVHLECMGGPRDLEGLFDIF